MKLYASTKSWSSLSADTLLIFVGSDTNMAPVYFADSALVDERLKGTIKKLLKTEGFESSVGATFVIQTHGMLPYIRVIVTGIGQVQELTAFDFESAVAAAVLRAKKSQSTSLVLSLPQEITERFGAFLTARLVTESIGFGMYSFLPYKNKKTRDKEIDIKTVTVIAPASHMQETMKGIVDGSTRASGTIFARDLVNEPSSVMTPSALARAAKSLAKQKTITCAVFGQKEITKFGMGAFLGVTKGSDEEPKFIKLVYKAPKAKHTICLVGKGITYDSGGLSLKPSSGMETMKCDMAGAATILGVFETLATQKPNISVVGLIATCENMPSGHAIKPGDVVRAMNGKTIEVVNTDAEGRLILADALSYAEKFVKSDYTIDVATLTGACMVALGEDVAGVFANDDGLAQSILDASQISGEKFWRLPLEKAYEADLKSSIADIQNISKVRYGGAINGALFLKEFVNEKTKWAHLDIAGPAFSEKETSLSRFGGTGFGVRTLLSFIEAQAGKK
ncbi:MAG: leucyl aminopeptidase [Microgenomates group bacterium]